MPSDRFPHDAAYKEFFSNRDMVKSLLLDFAPRDFSCELDFDSLEVCSGSYTTINLTQRHDDIVWRLRWKDSWCYIYIILEFQSGQDYWMALRILTYTSLLWEDLIKKGLVKRGELLPPVFPVVIYNGGVEWKASQNIKELIAPVHGELAAYQPVQKYFLLDEKRISNMLLDAARGPSSYIVRLERAGSREEVLSIYHELMDSLDPEKYAMLRRAIGIWGRMLFHKKPAAKPAPAGEQRENQEMIEETIARWENEIMQKGILRGKADGIAEGLDNQRSTLLEMLSDRFAELPASWPMVVNDIDDQLVLRQLTRSVWTVSSLDAFDKLLMGSIKSH